MSKTVPFVCNSANREGITIFELHGRLMDQAQADELIRQLDEEMPEEDGNVILDMHHLEYMNSTGLNIMINVLTKARNSGGEAVIARVNNSVRQLFVVTKLDTVFALKDSVDEAIAHLKKK